MKFGIFIHPDAENDLLEIASYFESERIGSGQKFLNAYSELLQVLELFPKAFSKKRGLIRESSVGHFPVIIAYRVHKKRVSIRRIIHAARNPKLRYRR